MVPVYSATKVGPDILEMKFQDRFFWVEASTVMSKDPVIWGVVAEELHPMWDYKGKLEDEQWERSQGRRILFHRILSPPAKMIWLFLSKAADAIIQEVMVSMVVPEEQAHSLGPTVGLTKDVPFYP